MDGDIGVAELLGKEAEQCLAALARKLELYRIKLNILNAKEKEAEHEERELERQIKELKEMELAYKHEAAAAREQLALKGSYFEELTKRASEQLSIRALEMETDELNRLITELQVEEERLTEEVRDVPKIDETTISSLLAETRALEEWFVKLKMEHEKVCKVLRANMAKASHRVAVRMREEEEEAEYCRQLEEAIAGMELLREEAELAGHMVDGGLTDANTKDGAYAVGVAAEVAPGAALTRCTLLRDELEDQLGKLATGLAVRVRANRGLAEELGILEDDLAAATPDSTTSGDDEIGGAGGGGETCLSEDAALDSAAALTPTSTTIVAEVDRDPLLSATD